jgi:hypothetical protein
MIQLTCKLLDFQKKENLDSFLKLGNNENTKTNFIFWNFKDQEK